jgi:Thrombospondin type 3 repeat
MLDSHPRRTITPAVMKRLSLALLAAAVAIAALPAGASAADFRLPSDGKVVRVTGKPAPSTENATPLTEWGPELASHRGNDDIADALDLTADVNGSICRFPNICFLDDDTTGATLEGGENNNCPEPSGPAFDSTVWYVFQVSQNGLLNVIVDNTLPNGPPPFLPVFQIFNGDTGDGFCAVGFPATTDYASTFAVGPNTTLGSLVYMAVGRSTAGGAPQGSFDLNLSWDPDSDNDGLTDSGDQCPGQAGSTSAPFNGCPDSDGDGIRDLDDACPSQSGPAQHQGCPDSDGDGIADRNDACAGLSSGSDGGSFGGCPDADNDGVPEGGQDRCPGENPARLNRADKRPRDGCADIIQLNAGVSHGFSGSDSRGLTISEWAVTNVIRGARVVVKCKLPGGGKCGKLTVKRASASVEATAARTIKVRVLKNKKLPYGTVITMRVTASRAAGRFIRSKLVRPPKLVVDKKFCMRPGSSKLRKRGCV